MNLDDLRDWFAGEDCVVVACGPSASPKRRVVKNGKANIQKIAYQHHWTFACNRSTPFCSPDFAACFEPPRDKDVWNHIRANTPPFVFGHHAHGSPRKVMVNKPLTAAQIIGKPWGDRPTETVAQSTFYAICIAFALGFETVGVVGLDHVGNTPFGKAHDNGARFTKNVKHDKRYGQVAEWAVTMGRRLLNLSDCSSLERIPFGTWDDIRPKRRER